MIQVFVLVLLAEVCLWINLLPFWEHKTKRSIGENQGILTEGEDSVLLTSLYQLDQTRCF